MLRRLLLAGLTTGALALAAVAPGTATATPSGEPRLVYDPPAGIYAYGPSVIDEGSTRWQWTCHNQDPRVIRDHIYATKFVRGTVVSDRSVLQASPSGWDSFHTCDPSVVAGSFTYGGQHYTYAMFYLGNDLDASAHNQVGVAFAKSLGGPWRKYPEPVVRFDNVSQWGAGQPSVLSLAPGTGRLELFYTQGDTQTRAFHRSVDLTNVDRLRVGAPVELTTSGLTGTDGGADWLNNYDLAYEPRSRRFVVVREQHPYPPEGDNPWWIGRAVQIASIDARTLLRGEGTWQVEGVVSPERTGFPRNHNAGLVRTKYGWLPRADRATVVFTDSCAGPTCDSLYEYDLWEVDQRLGRAGGSVSVNAGISWTPGSQAEIYNPAGQIYAYAPAAVLEANGTEHYWTCHNSVPGQIKDDIWHTKRVNGAIVSDRAVLSRSASGWDSFHVCDPAVVAGTFHYQGTAYSYAMFYLGNDVDASAHNQIGMAFARSLDGPWVKYPNPVVTFPFSDPGKWGVGQPAVTAVQPELGRVLLFYTEGGDTTRGLRRDLVLGDMSAPTIGPAVPLPNAGLTGTDGSADYLNNFDVAYDPPTDRFYLVREQHPYPAEGDNPWWIGRSLQVASIEGASVWSGTGTWRVEGAVNQALTGLPRNHNGGILRNVYGMLPSTGSMTVVFTESCAGSCDSLWTYDLWRISGTLT